MVEEYSLLGLSEVLAQYWLLAGELCALLHKPKRHGHCAESSVVGEAVQRSKRGPNGVEVWAWKMSTKSQRILRVQ